MLESLKKIKNIAEPKYEYKPFEISNLKEFLIGSWQDSETKEIFVFTTIENPDGSRILRALSEDRRLTKNTYYNVDKDSDPKIIYIEKSAYKISTIYEWNIYLYGENDRKKLEKVETYIVN